MSLATPKLRRTERGFAHWCPACGEMHLLYCDETHIHAGWRMTNADIHHPSFSPSYKHEGKQTVKDATGRWTGEWVTDPATGRALDFCCHYIITDGNIHYCADCTHSMSGQTIPMPDIPEHAAP